MRELQRPNRPTAIGVSRGLSASGDGFTRSIEWALTLAIFTGIGWLVDRRLGTVPVCMIIGVVVGAVGLFARSYYAYRHQMELLEASAPWARRGAEADVAVER